MESSRLVHISYKASGRTLGIVWKSPEDEWGTVVAALHYYAARVCGVPVWCVELLWPYDPWNEAQLPTNVSIQCVVRPEFEIAMSTDAFNRCCNCWEDCEDIEELFAHVLVQYWRERDRRHPREFLHCDSCTPQQLCDLCHVHLPGGGSSCLHCFAPLPEIPETDRDYLARVVSLARRGLTDSQMNRWQCVRLRVE